jgi:hypothetical protein
MTDREIFEKVRDHLLQQGRKSVNGGERCRYRGAGGMKCAIGCLIPDTNYDPKMEGCGVTGLLSRWPNCLGFEPNPSQFNLLVELQLTHDHRDVDVWGPRLDKIAHIFNLKESS